MLGPLQVEGTTELLQGLKYKPDNVLGHRAEPPMSNSLSNS